MFVYELSGRRFESSCSHLKNFVLVQRLTLCLHGSRIATTRNKEHIDIKLESTSISMMIKSYRIFKNIIFLLNFKLAASNL